MKRIITISREFGSGGRSIGKMLAENYHISLDSSEFGLSACVNIIMELAQADKEKNL